MAQNALAFDEYLKQQEIELQKDTHQDDVLYVIHEDLEGVGPVSLMALFNDSDLFVTLICYKYVAFPAERTAAVLELINTLNAEYTTVKFVETGHAVSAQVVVPFRGNFIPEIVIEMVALIFQSVTEVHPRFLEVVG